MIKTILIDDEPLARSIIKDYLKAYPQIAIVDECNDGFEGIKAIAEYQPDLIFLDVQMPKINGFEMLELIEHPPFVIFSTAFDEYAVKAFECYAIDYLLKPFSKERFDRAIQKYMDQHKSSAPGSNLKTMLEKIDLQHSQNQRVVVKTGNKIRIIPMQDIYYLEADDDYVKIHTQEGSFLKGKTMNYFESILDPQQFVRVHRSYIVQVAQITRIEPYEKENHIALLKSGIKIPISKTGYLKLRSVLEL